MTQWLRICFQMEGSVVRALSTTLRCVLKQETLSSAYSSTGSTQNMSRHDWDHLRKPRYEV